MVSKDDLLRALPIRGLRADAGTKSSKKGGAMAIADFEYAPVFQAANAMPEEEILARWVPFDDREHLIMCYDNVVRGVKTEFREHFGPELPAVRLVVHEVLPHPVESNELNNWYVGKRIVQEALQRLASA